MNTEYLEQLTEQVTDYPHTIGDSRLHNARWREKGCPYVWLDNAVTYGEKPTLPKSGPLQVGFKIEVFTDLGHGFHCVFLDSKFQFIFKNEQGFSHPTGGTFLVVNASYYGVGEHAAIFKLMEAK